MGCSSSSAENQVYNRSNVSNAIEATTAQQPHVYFRSDRKISQVWEQHENSPAAAGASISPVTPPFLVVCVLTGRARFNLNLTT